ncbi:MAG TPA: hypothetical protein VH082_09570 [Rudaea sp.]|nr:hypothetical protein [Rudaea sp.]
MAALRPQIVNGETRERRGAFATIGRALYDWLIPTCFLLVALYFAATTANVLARYALRQPSFDQFKEYAHYLSQPILTSIFMLENGHRPVFPALIANIEIAAMHGDQRLQLAIGCASIALSVLIIAIVAWRHAMPRAARAAAVLLAVVGILWLANARMLVQGMGELQVYLVVASVLAAALATWRAYRLDSAWAMVLAALACTVAMFTFGAGAAAFPTVIALGFYLRLRWRLLAIPACAWVICLALYMVVLPGHESVQHGLTLRPLDSALATARWLSSPWGNAFFGLADTPIQPWLAHGLSGMASAANSVVDITHVSWPTICTVFGVLGGLAFGVRIVVRYLRRAEPSRYETVANALCILGLLIGGVIALGRLDYLDALPTQAFADRYLAWPCLFWTGLALLILDDVCRSGRRTAIGAMLTWCFLLPFVLWPTHRSWAGWAAELYRAAERSAASARSDVFDPDVFPDNDDANRDDVLTSLAGFKSQRLAMFADPGWELMGTTVAPAEPRADIFIEAQTIARFDDPLSKLPSARVQGVVRDGLNRMRDCQLAVIDEDDRVVGTAQFSFYDRGGGIRLQHRAIRGFDAYIRDYRAQQRYRIAVIQTATRQLVAQAPIAPAG